MLKCLQFGMHSTDRRRIPVPTNCELDVQLTKDHVPVIYHDFLVSETGIDAPVHALTLEQVSYVAMETAW